MQQPKNKSRLVRKKFFRFILLITLILASKITVTILSQPKVTTDYVEKLNQLTKPVNYEPQNNAADHYQKAFDLFVEMPETLYGTGVTSLISPYKVHWPSELDPNTVNLLEEWLVENQPAFEQIELAVKKPYCWIERKLEKGKTSTMDIKVPELSGMRDITQAMLWNAVIKAYNGNDTEAFEDILTCYKMGIHKSRTPSLVMEQLLGLRLKRLSAETVLVILDSKQFDQKTLNAFKEKFEILAGENYELDLRAENLQMNEMVEMTFAHNPLGADRLAFSCYKGFQCMGGLPPGRWKNCFWGPTRKETTEHLDKLLFLHEPLKGKTLWEFKNTLAKQTQLIDELTYNNFFTQTLYPCYILTLEKTQNTKAIIDAAIVVTALKEYEADHKIFPKNLSELVKTGYLKKIPIDPYSNEDLGYIVTDGNFKLYSIGTDFEDNKAEAFKIEQKNSSDIRPMLKHPEGVYVPKNYQYNNPQSFYIYKDIVYWPVNNSSEIGSYKKTNWKKRPPPHNMIL